MRHLHEAFTSGTKEKQSKGGFYPSRARWTGCMGPKTKGCLSWQGGKGGRLDEQESPGNKKKKKDQSSTHAGSKKEEKTLED